jgi:hypothetical protein
MNNALPARRASADDEAFLQLRRAVEWESTGQFCKRLLTGSLIQAVLITPWLISLPPNVAEDSRPARHDAAVPIFAPPAPASIPPQLTLAPLSLPIPVKHELPSAPVPELAVDLTAMKLSFADDVGDQLPAVVRKNGGELALLDKEDRTIARYILQPPLWEVQEVIRDVSRKLRLAMDPPQRWAVFRNAATRYGVDLNRYRACAMFDAPYRRCLQDAIRAWALSGAPHTEGRVSSASLAFAADRPCGIEVLEVTLAPAK